MPDFKVKSRGSTTWGDTAQGDFLPLADKATSIDKVFLIEAIHRIKGVIVLQNNQVAISADAIAAVDHLAGSSAGHDRPVAGRNLNAVAALGTATTEASNDLTA